MSRGKKEIPTKFKKEKKDFPEEKKTFQLDPQKEGYDSLAKRLRSIDHRTT